MGSFRREPKGLQQLLPRIGGEEFLLSHFLGRPYSDHAPLERLGEIAGCSCLSDVPAFLERVSASGATGIRVRGWREAGDREVPASEAGALYATGEFTLVVDHAQKMIPEIDGLLRSILEDLGTPQAKVGCNVYLSPKGLGTRMHFDEQEVFFLQILGNKHWKIAPNLHVQHPPVSHFGGALDPQLRMLTSRLPDRLPDDHESLTLKRGSVLFLPRGYWHESRTVAESLHLTLTFPSSTWIDWFLERLKLRLLLRAEWRAPAMGIAGSGAVLEQAKRKERELLGELAKLLGEDFLGPEL